MKYSACALLVLLSMGCSSRGSNDVPDSSADSAIGADSTVDSAAEDGAVDATPDVAVVDATVDATADAAADGTVADAAADATPDAMVADAAPDAVVDATVDAAVDATVDATPDATSSCGELGIPCTVNSQCTMVGICSVEVGHCIPGRRPTCNDSTPCPDRYLCIRWNVDPSQGTCLDAGEVECSCGDPSVAGHRCP